MKNLDQKLITYAVAEEAVNREDQTDAQIKAGIEYQSEVVSPNVNDFYYSVYKAAQFLQFTGGLYNEDAYYDENNFCQCLTKSNNDYQLVSFVRTGAHSDLRQNNPPIKNANITVVNGIKIYEGGTFNLEDWQILYNSANSNSEATANTIIKRDENAYAYIKNPEYTDDMAGDMIINKNSLTKYGDNLMSQVSNLMEDAASLEIYKTTTQYKAGDYVLVEETIEDTNV